MRKALLSLLFALILSACQTPYQEMGFTGGVTAAPIAADTYRISARGNGYTDSTVVQDYVLLKAAETTLQAGHTHFVILGGQDATSQSFGQTAGTISTNVIGGTAFSVYNPGVTYEIIKPGQDIIIKIGTLPAGGNSVGAFNAAEVFAAINPRVQRPKRPAG